MKELKQLEDVIWKELDSASTVEEHNQILSTLLAKTLYRVLSLELEVTQLQVKGGTQYND